MPNASAWNNGSFNTQTGAGYGLRIDASYTSNIFQQDWTNVVLYLNGQANPITVILSDSADSGDCFELRDKQIGKWLILNQNGNWPNGQPSRFTLAQRGSSNIFDVF